MHGNITSTLFLDTQLNSNQIARFGLINIFHLCHRYRLRLLSAASLADIMTTPTPRIASAGPSSVTDRHGLFTISSGGQTPEFDVVFVHGLEGHHRKTWTRDSRPRPKRRWSWRPSRRRALRDATSNNPDLINAECFWPEDLLAKDFPEARIFTFGYDSSITHLFRESANQGSILDHSTSLLQRLSAERTDCLRRPLIFVAHSLGGLVVKNVRCIILSTSLAGLLIVPPTGTPTVATGCGRNCHLRTRVSIYYSSAFLWDTP